MVSTNEFKTGLTVTIDNDPWQVVEFQHVKPGKGAAFVRAKMRNLSTGAVVERTFNAGERLPKANIERTDWQRHQFPERKHGCQSHFVSEPYSGRRTAEHGRTGSCKDRTRHSGRYRYRRQQTGHHGHRLCC